MSFRDPTLLWFAWLLVVPLVLYLLPLPHRQVATSALYLWERFLQSERYGRSSERFRRALGFALAAAILLSLILAAAGLALGTSPLKARNVVVLVDASASMNAVVSGKPNLSRAKEAAAQLIESLDAGTQVVVAEAAGELNVLWPGGSGLWLAAAKVANMEPFEGACDLRRPLAEAWGLWGKHSEAEIFVFTDDELPASPWGTRAHAWIAPSAGDGGNAGIVAISATRSKGHNGTETIVSFTLANYYREGQTLSGLVVANGLTRAVFEGVALGAGQTTQRTARFDEPCAAAVQVVLDRPKGDVLAADDSACVQVPALEELRVGVVWPESKRRNDYVSAVLAALQDDGLIGPVVENPGAATPVTVYVNQLPSAWPEGGAIVLYPLGSGVIQVAGLQAAPLSVARQSQHALLSGLDFRGLTVKGAVQAAVPEWATPLVWADNNLPLIWAGQVGKSKVLYVGIPVMPSGSRLPLVACFPVLMRNALQWMLPQASAFHPGDRVGGWTSRKAGLVKGPDGRVHAFSVASTEESDLRRGRGLRGEMFGQRHSVSIILVVLAIALLAVEWGLFHKRLTE